MEGLFHVMHINLGNLRPQDTRETEELENKGLEELPNLLKIGIFLKKMDTYVFTRNICLHYLCYPIYHYYINE